MLRFLCRRCPGRYFAEAELALIASTLLLLYDWHLLPCKAEGGKAAAGGGEVGKGAPGDPDGRLPMPDLLKLVGVKVPAGPCWVQFERRQL